MIIHPLATIIPIHAFMTIRRNVRTMEAILELTENSNGSKIKTRHHRRVHEYFIRHIFRLLYV